MFDDERSVTGAFFSMKAVEKGSCSFAGRMLSGTYVLFIEVVPD